MAGNFLATFQAPYEVTDRDGLGVHLLTGLRTSEIALTSKFAIDKSERSPADLRQTHRVFTTQSEFERTQELNLDGEGSKDSMKIGAGLDIMIKHCVTKKSVLCASMASISAGKDTYDDATAALSAEAKATLEGNPDEFTRRFGTHFIGGYALGANFNSVLTFYMKSAKDQRNFGANVSGSYDGKVKGKGKSIKGSGKYGLDETTSSMISEARGKLFATGYSESIDVSDLNSIAKEFSNFSKVAMKNPTRITAICYPYSMLAEVQAIMRKHGRAGELLPEVEYSIVEAVCLEARRALRSMTVIGSLDRIADGVQALRQISDKYQKLLQQEIDGFRKLSLGDLAKPSVSLRDEIGLYHDAAAEDEPRSKAMGLYAHWLKDFRRAYDVI